MEGGVTKKSANQTLPVAVNDSFLMLAIHFMVRASTQSAFVDAKTLLELFFLSLNISLFLVSHSFQQMNFGRAYHALTKSIFLTSEPC